MTIGTIADTKNHLFALNIFEKFNLPFSYLIAGPSMDKVGEEVQRRVACSTNPNLTGIFKNITDDYDSLIQGSEFLILPYDLKRGGRNSQVVYDAFRNLTPIIAPDIEPFKMYIERYGIGFLYKEGDENSFRATIEKAAAIPKEHFAENFGRLYKDLSFDKIKKDFLIRIQSCL